MKPAHALILVAAALGVYWVSTLDTETETGGGADTGLDFLSWLPDEILSPLQSGWGFIKTGTVDFIGLGYDGMNASKSLFNYLRAVEGLKLKPYQLPGETWFTIGMGHAIKDGEEWMMNGITENQAYEIKRKDIAIMEGRINRNIKRPLTQGQFDCLVDIYFNTGNTAKSTIEGHLARGDEVSFVQYVKSLTKGGEWNKKRRSVDLAAWNSTEFVWPQTAAEFERVAASFRVQFGL